MKTLAELMLAPTRRILDYTRLLVALHHWTSEEHADRPDLEHSLEVFNQLQKYADQVRIWVPCQCVQSVPKLKSCPLFDALYIKI